jgi:hypothetical protein
MGLHARELPLPRAYVAHADPHLSYELSYTVGMGDTITFRPPVRLRCGATARRSVAIELNQSLVADPEVMCDLVEHDVSDLAA